MDKYDVIVIGAGVMGSATAYYLAKRGKKTLLLEQFHLPHTRGSSHGATRIIRKAYQQDFFVRMMKHAYTLWGDLERSSGVTLYRKVGLLTVEGEPAHAVRTIENTLLQFGLSPRYVTHKDMESVFPLLRLPTDFVGVIDDEAGSLYADKAVICFQTEFRKLGGILRDGNKVVGIEPGETVTVKTSKSSYAASGLVVCAGAWNGPMGQMLNLRLPLQPVTCEVCYWKEKVEGSHSNFPTFIYHEEGGEEIYGLPPNEYPGMFKICLHSGVPSQADMRDADVDELNKRHKKLAAFIESHFPGLEPTAAVRERCLYTLTPDRRCILDSHPRWKNIVVGAGFSGEGFKFSPVVGEILSELVLGGKPSFDLAPFKLSRFESNSKL